ncbi:putative toxin [Nocardia bhagyanarayanae]|uniref:Restriction endonuclease fold toxin 7 of polymorphic toxin system n=1 Tax=Nocardia bhagyanarayanae TaxID=1215925 RepID=A0A543EXA5_9NOCA|nr:putative toxin [Nocardia bhagyanarayanae]TQM26216.1 restriction endonuclease fold toxin 7 of polymorphic toxin system [Nocardia bhagyanarayanae]
MTELDVDPEAFYELSGAYSRASRSATNSLTKMDQELRGAVKMSGNDDSGVLWAQGYWTSGIEAVVTAGKATDVLAKMALLIRQSGINHDQSENVDDYNTGKQLPASDPGATIYVFKPLKSPSGGTRPKPVGWEIVMGTTKWIDGNADLMQSVATSWQTVASVFSTLDTELRTKMKYLAGSTSDEIPDINEAHTSVVDGLEILGDALRQQAGAVDGYAVVLRAAQEGAEWEMQLQTVVQAINTVNAATIGRPIKKEILDVANSQIEHSRDKIQGMLSGLADAQRVSGATFTAVSATTVSAINTKFTPILDKQLKNPPPPTDPKTTRRNKLEGAKGEARAGIDVNKPKESIPSVTGRRNSIPDDLDHTTKRLTEVKNVQYQGYTDQLKDDMAYCQARGYEFVLITDHNTRLTQELQDLVNQGKIKHVTMDFRS